MRPKTVLIGCYAAVVLAASGCTNLRTQTYGQQYERVDDDVTYPVFKLAMHEYTQLVGVKIEIAADEIAHETDDPVIERNALLFKVNAIPAAQLAGYRLDPGFAAFDSWVYTIQMREFLTTGPGSDVFGAYQHIAVDAVADLEKEIHRIGESITVDEEALQELVNLAEEHADENPPSKTCSLPATPICDPSTWGGEDQLTRSRFWRPWRIWRRIWRRAVQPTLRICPNRRDGRFSFSCWTSPTTSPQHQLRAALRTPLMPPSAP